MPSPFNRIEKLDQSTPSVIIRIALLLVCSATLSSAQQPAPQPVPTPPVPMEPALMVPIAPPSFERPNGALLRPASLVYSLSLHRDGQVTTLGNRTVSVVEVPLAGMPVWLIAEQRTGTAVETADSVHLTRADLSPERWVATIGRAQLAASFTRDSIFGVVQSYQGRSSFATALPRDALLSAGMVERLVELLPLHAGYRAAVTLLLVDSTGPRAMPAELTVVRDEQLIVGGGSVDCWLVALRAGVVEQRLWVSREGARVVRTEQATASGLLVGELQ